MNITSYNILSTESVFGRNVSKLCQSIGLKSLSNLIGGGKNYLQNILIQPKEEGDNIPDSFTFYSLGDESIIDTSNALKLQDINGVNQAPSREFHNSADGAAFASLFIHNSAKIN